MKKQFNQSLFFFAALLLIHLKKRGALERRSA